jgi:hypothetical protein
MKQSRSELANYKSTNKGRSVEGLLLWNELVRISHATTNRRSAYMSIKVSMNMNERNETRRVAGGRLFHG